MTLNTIVFIDRKLKNVESNIWHILYYLNGQLRINSNS